VAAKLGTRKSKDPDAATSRPWKLGRRGKARPRSRPLLQERLPTACLPRAGKANGMIIRTAAATPPAYVGGDAPGLVGAWPPPVAPVHPRNRRGPVPARWRRCDKDAARPTGTSGVLTDFGPGGWSPGLPPGFPGPGRYRHCGRGWDGRAASSTDQGGGKRRAVIECALSLAAAGWGGACCALGRENIISVL
jgi:hypothetical protein